MMIEKIKYFFIGIGILSLIAIFFITGQSLKIHKLKGLLKKNYDTRIDILTKKRKVLKKKVKNNVYEVDNIRNKISYIDKKRKEIKKNVKNLDKASLNSAINNWFHSR